MCARQDLRFCKSLLVLPETGFKSKLRLVDHFGKCHSLTMKLDNVIFEEVIFPTSCTCATISSVAVMSVSSETLSNNLTGDLRSNQ